MRHRHGLRKLNRTSSHRLAMLRNMANSLFTYEAIRTTLPKAKELRRVAEPLITLGKSPTLANRRLAFDRLRDKGVVHKLFSELGPRYAQRPGGYLRILKFGSRVGDNAPMALIELLDRPDPSAQPAADSEPAKDKKAAKRAKADKTDKTDKAGKKARSAPTGKAAKAPKSAKSGTAKTAKAAA